MLNKEFARMEQAWIFARNSSHFAHAVRVHRPVNAEQFMRNARLHRTRPIDCHHCGRCAANVKSYDYSSHEMHSSRAWGAIHHYRIGLAFRLYFSFRLEFFYRNSNCERHDVCIRETILSIQNTVICMQRHLCSRNGEQRNQRRMYGSSIFIPIARFNSQQTIDR